jgi:hypothetical protein
VKIRIKRANTECASISVLDLFTRGVIEYVEELRQQARWNAEKCQHES